MVDVLRRAGDALTPAELYGLLRLRVDVFVVEQECPYPELDGQDLVPSTQHLWTGHDGDISACLRVLAEPGGVLRIGRVCTAKAARGTGVASTLMRAAMEQAPGAEYVLDAQTYAEGFYARFGFVAEGEPFDEDGIEHVTMRSPAGR